MCFSKLHTYKQKIFTIQATSREKNGPRGLDVGLLMCLLTCSPGFAHSCRAFATFISPPRSAVAGDYWIRVRPSVCLSVKLGSYDLVKNEEFQHNLELSIPRPNSITKRRIEWTFYNERIYIEVVHLGIGLVVQPKIGVVRLGQKWGISTQFGVYFSATELHIYWAESNETFYIYWTCASGYWFCRAT